MERKDNNIMTKPLVVCLMAMLCCLLWGSAFPCVKIGYNLFEVGADDTASQILYAGIRFTLAGILVVLFSSLGQKKMIFPKKTSWGMVFKVSMLQTVIQYLFFYVGLAHTSGVKGSIIEGSHVFFAILIASLIFRQEKLTVMKTIGCIVGFAGVVVVNLTSDGFGGGFAFNGEGFLIISCIAYAFSSVLIKKYSEKESPVTISGYQFLLGGVIMIAVGLIMGGSVHPVSAGAYVMMLYMAMISAVAYSVWGILLKHNPVSRVTVYGFTNPIFGVILSTIFLDEASALPVKQCIIALVLVCIGIYTVNRAEEK